MAGSKKQRKAAARSGSAAVMPPPAARQAWWPWALAIVVVIVAVFEIYGPALNGPFLLDDTYLPYDAPTPSGGLRNWIAGVRPLLMFSYWLNYRSAGAQDTYGYHAVNVVLHLLNGGLVWFIVRRLLSRFEQDRWRLNALSGFAALLFLVHPLNTESVSYVASRSETLSVFFFYLAFALFLYRRREAIGWGRAAIILVVFGAAVLTKEHAVVLAALLLLTDYWWNPPFSSEGIRRNWRLYAPMLAAAALGGFWVARVLARATTAGFHVTGLTWYGYFFTECRAIWVYLLLYVLPLGQNIDHEFAVSNGLLDHGAIIGLVALLAAIAAAWVLRRRFPLAAYGLLVFLLLLAPTSSFVPIADPLVERRLYLPFIGLLFITIDLVRRWRASRQVLAGVLGAVLVVEGALAYQRNQLWGDDIAMWRDSVSKSPNKLRPRFQLAGALYMHGQCTEAAEEYSRAASLGKPGYNLLLDWGLAEDCAHHPDVALERIRQALTVEQSAHGYTQLAKVYGDAGRFDEALAALDQAAKYDPNYDIIYFYRGTVFAKEHNFPAAIAEYRHGLALNPQNTAIREALAQVEQAASGRR
ncbi:MAG TPA: tetratricopeptide repeat protein [Bryobacteraceae bacterium]|nr:tetratricopeptide repeat protein [Bryobacteraceae bacterium]